MVDGLHHVAQPAWYVGNNNKVIPPETNLFLSAARYGFRGSKEILQYKTEPYEVPSKTHNERTPKFLRSDEYINEWAPPIFAAKYQTVNSIETPKLWPENTEYATGYPRKKFPKSWIYKRETTLASKDPMVSTDSLISYMSKVVDSNEMLREYAKLESTKKISSLPIDSVNNFSRIWNDKVKTYGTSTLKSTLSKDNLNCESHTLMDPSDRMKYSGSTAMIVHTQSADELKFRVRMEREKLSTQYKLRWQTVQFHLKIIISRLKRNETTESVISDLLSRLRATATKNGSQTSMSRADFIKTCNKIPCFEENTPKQLSLLYSIFDPMKKNCMRFAELGTALMILDNPSQPTDEKLRSLWNMNVQFGYDRNLFDVSFGIVTSFCSSNEDFFAVENAFKEEFRPKCYEMAIYDTGRSNNKYRITTASTERTQTASTDQPQAEEGNMVESVNASIVTDSDPKRENSVSVASIRNSRKQAIFVSKGDLFESADSVDANAIKTGLSVQPQYNICEHYLNEITFVRVLRNCPKLYELINKQLTECLTKCYGSDVRTKDESAEEEVQDEGWDFSWILRKKN